MGGAWGRAASRARRLGRGMRHSGQVDLLAGGGPWRGLSRGRRCAARAAGGVGRARMRLQERRSAAGGGGAGGHSQGRGGQNSQALRGLRPQRPLYALGTEAVQAVRSDASGTDHACEGAVRTPLFQARAAPRRSCPENVSGWSLRDVLRARLSRGDHRARARTEADHAVSVAAQRLVVQVDSHRRHPALEMNDNVKRATLQCVKSCTNAPSRPLVRVVLNHRDGWSQLLLKLSDLRSADTAAFDVQGSGQSET